MKFEDFYYFGSVFVVSIALVAAIVLTGGEYQKFEERGNSPILHISNMGDYILVVQDNNGTLMSERYYLSNGNVIRSNSTEIKIEGSAWDKTLTLYWNGTEY